jgi:hypothetical protein
MICENQVRNDNHFATTNNSLSTAIDKLSARLDTSEALSAAKFLAMEARIQALYDVKDSPAAATSSTPMTRPSLPTPSASGTTTPIARQGPPEDCLVYIRGFPSPQPSFVLKGYADEAIGQLTTSDQRLVKVRISPADTQFSLVFPHASMAANFVEDYRARDMVFVDVDKTETRLFCRTGRPLAFRRRGGLIRPVYTVLEDILRKMPSMAMSTISQNSKTRAGRMTTEFYVQEGRRLTLLFHLIFSESTELMTIEQVVPPSGGSPLSDDDLALIAKAASVA